MSRSLRAAVAFAVVAILGGAGLVLAGAFDQRATAASLEIQNSRPAITLGPGRSVCQAPATAPAPFAGLQFWFTPVRAPGAMLHVSVLSARGALLASGSAHVLSWLRTVHTVRLDRTVAAAGGLSFCLENQGPVRVVALGAPPEAGSGSLGYRGRQLDAAMSIVLLRPRSRSLLSLLPTVFERASLFRPTWIGAWAFWVLLGALLATFPLLGFALTRVVREDP